MADAGQVDWLSRRCLQLSSDAATVVVAPERGGRIVSLRDATGREWLAQPEERAWRSPMRREGFLTSDMAGWDECAPTVVATACKGVPYPDHGDLWARQWEADGAGRAELHLTCEAAWFTFRRTITATRRGIRLDYRAVSHAAVDMPFLWAMHPQLRAPAGSTVVLPAEVVEVVDALDRARGREVMRDALRAIGSLDPGGMRKFYPAPETPVGSAALVHGDGARLELRWDAAVAPWIGVWMDRGALAREDVVALEPTTGWYDDAAWAAANATCAVLRPAEPLEWWVEVDLVPPG